MLQVLFPWVNSKKANKKISDKIKKISEGELDNIVYMKGYENLNLNEAKEFFDKTLSVKKSLEDKLKTSLFSVTIGITVLTSAITLLFNDGISPLSAIYRGVIFFTGSVAIIYMILAGIFAIRTISGHISVYQLFPEDIANNSEEDKKKSISICAELNSLSNIIRQNLMSVSFHCIINSLFVITLFFFLVGGSSFINIEKPDKPVKVNVTVQPNKNDIELLKSKISTQSNEHKNDLKLLQSKINYQDDILEINKNIEKIEKQIFVNKLSIEKLENVGQKSSNK